MGSRSPGTCRSSDAVGSVMAAPGEANSRRLSETLTGRGPNLAALLGLDSESLGTPIADEAEVAFAYCAGLPRLRHSPGRPSSGNAGRAGRWSSTSGPT
jgi:hypothetical protein